MKSSKIDENLAKTFLVRFTTPQHLKQWIDNFLGLDFPDSWVDPDSNSSPVHWMYQTYKMYETNTGNTSPDTIVISSRESYKTLSEAVFAIIMMCHFGASIAHMAAIVPQATAAQKYIDAFIQKVKPYLTYHGIELDAQNSKEISLKLFPGTPKEKIAYMKIIVCTVTGANCVSPETTLWKPDGTKIIAKDVSPGDELLTFDFIEQKDATVKVGSVSYTEKLCREVLFDDGSNIIASKDHRIFTDSGWKTIATLRVGDKATSYKGVEVINTVDDKNIEIQRDPMQMIYGSLLGDASVTLTPQKCSARFSMSHTWEQREYLLTKAMLFDKIGVEYNLSEVKSENSTSLQVKCLTKTHPIFFEIRNEIYKPEKIVTTEFLNKLTWEGIAYWFMDDVRGNPKSIGSDKDHCYELATCCFSREENELIAKWFSEKGIEAYVDSVTNQTGKRYDIVKFTLESSRQLTEKIEKWFVPCMSYKLVPTEKMLFAEAIDSDVMVKSNNRGFTTSTEDFRHFIDNTRSGRQWRNSLKEKLTSTVIKIKDVGMKSVIDVHVDTDKHNLKSFYANSKKLLHNSAHTNIFTIDEIDTIRSAEQIRAYKEAQYIPGVFNGQHPITIKTSTLKFPGGLFSKEMDKALKNNFRVYKWNIIDITEKCQPERHKPDLPKQKVYVAKGLPLRTISRDEYLMLNSKEREQYDEVDAMGGCAKCPLLPVCRQRLASRPECDTGGLWKPIDFTISQFTKTDPDLAEAQLMCWKPSSQGMVYPRFVDKADGSGNTYTLNQAYEAFTGEKLNAKITLPQLVDVLQKRGIKFYCGVDWGFRHAFAITVSAVIPGGEWWLIDSYSISGLEFEQMLDLSKSVRDLYKPAKWFADTAQPMFIKAFKKNKMPCAEFKKDVMGGIESVRGQIIDAKGTRRLKVIVHDRTQLMLKMFAEHCFLLDSLGNLTNEPDDSDVADIADTIRYQGQNLFKPKANIVTSTPAISFETPAPERTYQDWLTQKTRELTEGSKAGTSGKTSDGNIVWDFGSEDE